MTVNVHTVRFYNLKTDSIKCLCTAKDEDLLAVARENNSIEIWNIMDSPHIERTIIGTCVESLAWYKKRLFSVGIQGSLIEYDLFSQTAKYMHPLTSGSSWCVAVSAATKQLAAGTEDGFINIFDIDDDNLTYKKLMDKQEGRVYCLVWDKTGKHIVSGSIDTVRVWNVSSGHAIFRMMTGRSVLTKDKTIISSVVVTSDMIVISGDSRGKLCFWDAVEGVPISQAQSHRNAILSLCLSDDENIVYCAGIDPVVSSYARVKVRGSDRQVKWIRSFKTGKHEHPVKSLAINKNILYSGGVDGYLVTNSYYDFSCEKYPPLLKPPAVSISKENRLVMFRYPRSIMLWKLQSPDPVNLLEWRPAGDLMIKCAALSNNGKWLACSTQDRFRLYNIIYNNKKPLLTRIQINTKKSLFANCLTFSEDNKKLAIGTLSCVVRVIDLEQQKPTLLQSYYPYKENHLTDNLGFLTFSPDCSYLVTTDLQSNIAVWFEGKFHFKCPRSSSAITAIAIQQKTNVLVVVYSNQQVSEFCLEQKCMLKSSVALDVQHPVHSIAFDQTNPNIILFGNDTEVNMLDKDEGIDNHSSLKKIKFKNNSTDNENGIPQPKIESIKKYEHLVYFGELGKGEMIAVEVSPVTLQENLPIPICKRSTFGNK